MTVTESEFGDICSQTESDDLTCQVEVLVGDIIAINVLCVVCVCLWCVRWCVCGAYVGVCI